MGLRPQALPESFARTVVYENQLNPAFGYSATTSASHPDRPNIRVQWRNDTGEGNVRERLAWMLWVQGDEAFGEDFSSAPKSLTEARAQKNQRARDWEPRDALIACLRAIDSGELAGIDELVIAYHRPLEPTPGNPNVHDFNYFISTSSVTATMGLINIASHHIMSESGG